MSENQLDETTLALDSSIHGRLGRLHAAALRVVACRGGCASRRPRTHTSARGESGGNGNAGNLAGATAEGTERPSASTAGRTSTRRRHAVGQPTAASCTAGAPPARASALRSCRISSHDQCHCSAVRASVPPTAPRARLSSQGGRPAAMSEARSGSTCEGGTGGARLRGATARAARAAVRRSCCLLVAVLLERARASSLHRQTCVKTTRGKQAVRSTRKLAAKAARAAPLSALSAGEASASACKCFG